jgi:hypothetical protein
MWELSVVTIKTNVSFHINLECTQHYIYMPVSERSTTLSNAWIPLFPIFPLAFMQVPLVHGLPYSFHPSINPSLHRSIIFRPNVL